VVSWQHCLEISAEMYIKSMYFSGMAEMPTDPAVISRIVA
jgi:hypothetical protein